MSQKMTSFLYCVLYFFPLFFITFATRALAQATSTPRGFSQTTPRPATLGPLRASPTGPRAPAPALTYTMTEKLVPGILIANVPLDARLASIHPPAELRTFRYEILQGAGGAAGGAGPQRGGEFVVDAVTGLVRTNASVDRDVICFKMAACVIGVDVAIVQPKQHFQVNVCVQSQKVADYFLLKC